VRFSDGREVTAADAAFTLESIRSGVVPTYRRTDLEMVSAVRATGRYELEVELSRPFAPFLSGLAVGVVPDGTVPGSAPGGCGPYRLDRWVRGQWLFFSANPHASPPPKCKTLAFKVVPDAVVRVLEVWRGSVDLVVNDLPPDALVHFAEEGYALERGPGANYRYIGLNCGRPPLDRAEVRSALAMAVDRRALLNYIQDGFGRPAGGLLCPDNWAHVEGLKEIPFDPVGARTLLASAGYGPGRPLRLSYKTSTDMVARRIAVAVQDYLGRVGVVVEVRSLEWGTFFSDVQRGDFDLFGLIWVGISDPDALRPRFTTAQFPPAGLNRGRYSNPEVDRLLEAASGEPDQAVRRDLYWKAQRILSAEVPYISLWHPDNVAVGRRGLTGIAIPPDGSFRFLAGVGWGAGAEK
jgi:peptide/nickel transport system substrate-binding protein